VSIINASTGEKIDECPQPHELKDLLDDLWRWLDDTKNMSPFARAFAFHFIAVSIHPFADGNGRTVRLMQHLLLLLILEYLDELPKSSSYAEAKEIMENMISLSPSMVQNLLESCTSLKVKRLFLHLGEKINHPWFKKLNLDVIDLGSGKRVIFENGVLDKKYNITVPKDESYEEV
jgi:hypothetical protein